MRVDHGYPAPAGKLGSPPTSGSAVIRSPNCGGIGHTGCGVCSVCVPTAAMPDDLTEALDALENILIADGMGWDMEGVLQVARDICARQRPEPFS